MVVFKGLAFDPVYCFFRIREVFNKGAPVIAHILHKPGFFISGKQGSNECNLKAYGLKLKKDLTHLKQIYNGNLSLCSFGVYNQPGFPFTLGQSMI